jgi:hypothetical protein
MGVQPAIAQSDIVDFKPDNMDRKELTAKINEVKLKYGHNPMVSTLFNRTIDTLCYFKLITISYIILIVVYFIVNLLIDIFGNPWLP